ncbi:GAF domain-containing protein [bacterium]|nr:GAF domain-containing protein [bacterium]
MKRLEVSVNKQKDGKALIKHAISALHKDNVSQAKEDFVGALNYFKKKNSVSYMSICLSFLGLTDYILDRNNYSNSLALIHDGAYMADYSNSTSAKLVNEFVSGSICFAEKNDKIALLHYENAKNFATEEDEFSLISYILGRIKQIKDGENFTNTVHNDPLVSLVKIGRSITALTDINVLLKVIAEETKNAMQADRCTVFIYDKEKNELWSKVALGLDSQEIRFPADKGLAGYVVKTGETLNIADAYNDLRFNKEVDLKTGYRTKTILCMPIMNNNHEIIGAFQVLNKSEGVFTKNDEDLLVAIGGSASIALENAQLFEEQKRLYKEQKQLFESFINTLASSIDARDKITAGHSSRVKLYSMLIAEELELDENTKELIEKAAILHDIGKIGIRDSVLQKEGKLTDEEYAHIQEHVSITHNILDNISMSSDFRIITEIACSHHEKYDGSGYYRKLKGENIPFGGRILAVADVFDAITSKRHYRDKMPIKNVINILKKDSGTHFDKNMVESFLKISLDKIVKVFLTETHNCLSPDDCSLLSGHNLEDIFEILSKENVNSEEQKLVDLFNYYYSGGMQS